MQTSRLFFLSPFDEDARVRCTMYLGFGVLGQLFRTKKKRTCLFICFKQNLLLFHYLNVYCFVHLIQINIYCFLLLVYCQYLCFFLFYFIVLVWSFQEFKIKSHLFFLDSIILLLLEDIDHYTMIIIMVDSRPILFGAEDCGGTLAGDTVVGSINIGIQCQVLFVNHGRSV